MNHNQVEESKYPAPWQHVAASIAAMLGGCSLFWSSGGAAAMQLGGVDDLAEIRSSRDGRGARTPWGLEGSLVAAMRSIGSQLADRGWHARWPEPSGDDRNAAFGVDGCGIGSSERMQGRCS